MARKPAPPKRHARGFEQTASLLRDRVRAAGEKRGFVVTRLLTHWSEIVGADIARISRPAKVGYGRGGFGATLTLLTTGAQAPLLEMQKERIREKVNACYGYNAISKILITQTAPEGFAEGQAHFEHAPGGRAQRPAADAGRRRDACALAGPVQDDGLRAALEALGENVLTRNTEGKGTHDDE